jgi:hypothetical protein
MTLAIGAIGISYQMHGLVITGKDKKTCLENDLTDSFFTLTDDAGSDSNSVTFDRE